MEGKPVSCTTLSLEHPVDLTCFIMLTHRGWWVAYILFFQQSRIYQEWIFKTSLVVCNCQIFFSCSFVAHKTVSQIVSGKYLGAPQYSFSGMSTPFVRSKRMISWHIPWVYFPFGKYLGFQFLAKPDLCCQAVQLIICVSKNQWPGPLSSIQSPCKLELLNPETNKYIR